MINNAKICSLLLLSLAVQAEDNPLKKMKDATVEVVDAALEKTGEGLKKAQEVVKDGRNKLSEKRTAQERFDGWVDEVTDVKRYQKACQVIQEHGCSSKMPEQLWRKHKVQVSAVLSATVVTLANLKKAPRNVLLPVLLLSGYKVVRDALRG